LTMWPTTVSGVSNIDSISFRSQIALVSGAHSAPGHRQAEPDLVAAIEGCGQSRDCG
jgi:hypothetical protein